MKKLSERESNVLQAILEYMPHGADGNDLASRVSEPEQGIHRTAASLVRKNLAWRSSERPTQYKITQDGRDALAGKTGGHRKWRV